MRRKISVDHFEARPKSDLYRTVASLLLERLGQLHTSRDRCLDRGHKWFMPDGRCHVCVLVDADPPFEDWQIARLRELLPPVPPAVEPEPARRRVRRVTAQ